MYCIRYDGIIYNKKYFKSVHFIFIFKNPIIVEVSLIIKMFKIVFQLFNSTVPKELYKPAEVSSLSVFFYGFINDAMDNKYLTYKLL